VSRPPEKAMPTRSPTGSEVSTLDTSEIICTLLHEHPIAPEKHPHRLRRGVACFMIVKEFVPLAVPNPP
jgi:hypothetical protein